MDRNSIFLSFVLSVATLGCSVEDSGRVAEDRHPLGKADAIGSCRAEDGGDLCGGQSEGNCWCDDQCVDFGDCCADKVAVCEDIGLAVESITSAEMFDALSFKGDGGLILGKSVKFLIDNRDPSDPQLVFMNANFEGPGDPDQSRFHFHFARAVLPGFSESVASFNQVTYDTNDKRFFAGTVQEYNLSDDEQPIYGIQFYPQDAIHEATVLVAVEQVAKAVDIPDTRLAFVAMGPQMTTDTVAPAIENLGVLNTTIDEILGALTYIPMQLGEAWGFLRIFPEDHDLLSAIDIPVFAELPLDLTVVAGSVTVAVQDASSHINLKSKERGTPNMVLRDAGPDHEVLGQFDNRPVHLTVRADGFDVELSTEEVVLEKLREKTNKPWQELHSGPATEPASYKEMCPADEADCLDLSPSFGGKAANLGFLGHRRVLGRASDAGSLSAQLGYDATPAGLGVPVLSYFDFVDHPPNAALREALDDLIEREKEGVLSPAMRVELLKNVQQLFLDGELPPGLEESIRSKVAQVLPADIKSIKIRSSANAEDIPGFDGAGLYESYRAKLNEPDNADGSCVVVEKSSGGLKVEPKSVACAVKGVYASLWNKRAIEERSFARIDHATSGMGLAIVQRYKERAAIAANSVIVTRVLNSSGVFGYTFSSQVDNNVVTNPAPGTASETVIAAFLPSLDPTFTVTRFAKPEPDQPARTTTVMTQAQMNTMLDINQAVETAYCRASPSYYDGSCSSVLFDIDKPKALDLEFKLYENGDFLCKQVREFHGR